MLVDQGEQLLTQTVDFNQMTEFANRRLVRRRFAAQIDPNEVIAALSYSASSTAGRRAIKPEFCGPYGIRSRRKARKTTATRPCDTHSHALSNSEPCVGHIEIPRRVL
jgi:hypothetical protein